VLYKFENTETGEAIEVEMSMKDYEPYKGPSGDDKRWQRIYEAPQINMGVSTSKSIDAWDNNSFVNRTKEMKGSYGELLDHAEDLSNKRAKDSLTGEDPVKRKYLNKYSSERGGKIHPSEMKKVVENNHVKVEL
jgi:hypothetical protein|tara:strand:+ start:75 stop:476 length:402 start_codon:yes stop_codon:yes gene_type:complete